MFKIWMSFLKKSARNPLCIMWIASQKFVWDLYFVPTLWESCEVSVSNFSKNTQISCSNLYENLAKTVMHLNEFNSRPISIYRTDCPLFSSKMWTLESRKFNAYGFDRFHGNWTCQNCFEGVLNKKIFFYYNSIALIIISRKKKSRYKPKSILWLPL